MTRVARTLAAGLGLLTMMVSACGDTPTTPTATEATAVTESYSSIVSRRGWTSRSFTTTTSGTITVSLTSLAQDASIGVGVGVSDPASGLCTLTYSVVTTQYSGRQLSATADPGTYCAAIYDIGELTDTRSFTLTIVHF